MKNIIVSLIIIVYASRCLGQQFTDLYGDYLGQTPPGDVPVIFAPGIVSGTSLEHSATAFSSNGNEVYWASRKNQSDKITTWYMKRTKNRWTQPQAFEPFPDSSGCYDPFFAIGNNRFYFAGEGRSSDIWSEPVNMGSSINTMTQETYPVVSPDGKYLFFTRWTDNDNDMDVYWVSTAIIEKLRNDVNMKKHMQNR